jgi:hypothetical protein
MELLAAKMDPMKGHYPMKHLFASLLLVGLLAVPATAEVVVEKHENGKTKLRYVVDAQGRKDGSYAEYFPNGKVKVRATYKVGKLDGPYTENDEDGQKSVSAVYRTGKLHGTLSQYVKGRTVLTQPFEDGKLVHPKSLGDIRAKLKAILTPGGDRATSGLAADRQAVLRRLKAYRYLMDVPYDNLVIDDKMNEAAQAAAKLCAKLGRLDHTPKNPGWPEDEFKLAFKGATHSNLAWSTSQGLTWAMAGWIDDSDEGNVDRLGHRRWCLNPPMKKVGFGKSGEYMAMWCFDTSQPKVPDYRFVSYPARGLMPVEYFPATNAWNVSLNPKKYRKPADSIEPKIYRVDGQLKKQGEPLKLNYANVNNLPFGVPYCIIFRPEKSAVAAGKRYLVEIEGLKLSSGLSTVLRFVVEFVRLR